MDVTSGTLQTVDETRNRELRMLRADLGPAVLAALADAATTDVYLNPDGTLRQTCLGASPKVIGRMGPSQAEALICTAAALLKTTVTSERPLLEGELPTGERFTAQLSPVVTAPTFAIRKPASSVYTLEQYVGQGTLSPDQAQRLTQAVAGRKNLVISGGMGTGKTTLANAILQAISVAHPEDRLLILEDTRELQPSSADVVAFRAQEHVSLTQLVRASLRMTPTRILVGEVRGPEARDLLVCWNLGHPGGLCTVHADSASAALDRLELLVDMHPQAPRHLARLIVAAAPIIVHLERDPARGRRVTEILEVTGHHREDGYQTTPF